MVHLKRYSMPKFWGMKTKEETFALVPKGPHPRQMSIPIGVFLRSVVGYADTMAEAQKILHEGKVLVDKKIVKSKYHGVGLMDIVEIPEVKKAYRLELVKKGLSPKEVKIADRKLCRITGKSKIRGGKLQVNLHDGRNLILDKNSYSVGDTLLISIPDQKVLAHYPLKKGADSLILAGGKAGMRGMVEEVKERKGMLETSTVTLKVGESSVQTLKSYIFVIGPAEVEK